MGQQNGSRSAIGFRCSVLEWDSRSSGEVYPKSAIQTTIQIIHNAINWPSFLGPNNV